MSGQLHPPQHAPLLAPDKAAKLLDDVLYERVLGCIDLEALFMIELDLSIALTDAEVGDEHYAQRLAQELVDRALRRLPGEVRRNGFMRPCISPCPALDDEVLDAAKRKRGDRGS